MPAPDHAPAAPDSAAKTRPVRADLTPRAPFHGWPARLWQRLWSFYQQTDQKPARDLNVHQYLLRWLLIFAIASGGSLCGWMGSFVVTPATHIFETPAAGFVQHILLPPSATPSPSATATSSPTPTSTPLPPSATLTASATPSPSATPAPSGTATTQATITPSPTATPQPTATNLPPAVRPVYFCSKTIELDPLSQALQGYYVRLAETDYLKVERSKNLNSKDIDYLLMGFVNEGSDVLLSIAADPTAIWTPAAQGQAAPPGWYDPRELERQAQVMGYHAVTVFLVGERKSTLPSGFNRIACGQDWSGWNFARVQVSLSMTMRAEAGQFRLALSLPPGTATASPGMGELSLPRLYSRGMRIK